MKTNRFLVLLGLGVFCFGGFLGAMKKREDPPKFNVAEYVAQAETRLDLSLKLFAVQAGKVWRFAELEALYDKFLDNYSMVFKTFASIPFESFDQKKELFRKSEKMFLDLKNVFFKNLKRIENHIIRNIELANSGFSRIKTESENLEVPVNMNRLTGGLNGLLLWAKNFFDDGIVLRDHKKNKLDINNPKINNILKNSRLIAKAAQDAVLERQQLERLRQAPAHRGSGI